MPSTLGDAATAGPGMESKSAGLWGVKPGSQDARDGLREVIGGVMVVEAIRGGRAEAVPGIPSRLPALAGEVFGTFVLVLSGTATLLATARIGHGTVPGVAAQ